MQVTPALAAAKGVSLELARTYGGMYGGDGQRMNALEKDAADA